MRLNGDVIRFRISGAGAFFNEVDFNEEGEEVDLGVANDDGAQRFVAPSGRKANITARGFVEATSNLNFIDVCKACAVVDVTDLTGVDSDRLDFYKPWQVLRSGLRHGKRTASEDSVEIISTHGAIPADFDPDAYGPTATSGTGSG